MQLKSIRLEELNINKTSKDIEMKIATRGEEVIATKKGFQTEHADFCKNIGVHDEKGDIRNDLWFHSLVKEE